MSDLEKTLKDKFFLGFPELIGIVEDLFQPSEEYAPFNAETTERGTYSYTSGDYVINYEFKRRGTSFEGSISLINTAKRNKILFSADVAPLFGDYSHIKDIKDNKRDEMYATLLDAIKSYQQPEKS